jgi:hypothetical protein
MARKVDPWVALLSERIETVGLSIRCYRRLKEAGINTILDLLYAKDEVLAPYFDELHAGMIRLGERHENRV